MAKKGQAAKGAGTGKSKIPKKVGGIKIPKEFRDAAMSVARHPVISDIVAAGLLAAAAALTDSKDLRKTAKAVGDEALGAAGTATKKAGRASTVVKAAATAMGKTILDELGEGLSGKTKTRLPKGR